MTFARIPTYRSIEYARGWLALGMVNEAALEIECVEGVDRVSVDVLALRVELYAQAQQWDMVIFMAKSVIAASPHLLEIWIQWAFALRKAGSPMEAKRVLLSAEEHGHTSPLLNFNLARYCCVLGEFEEARTRLCAALKEGHDWRSLALSEPDLAPVWDAVIEGSTGRATSGSA